MQTYTQLIRTKSKVRKQFWYICGTEDSLRFDAVELAKDHVYSDADSVFTQTFTSLDFTPELLVEFFEMPFFEERKLAIVYGADRITRWAEIKDILRLADTSTFVLFIGHDVPESDSDVLSVFTNNQKARSVKCDKLSDEALKDLVQDRINITSSGYSYLKQESNNDIEWLLNKVRVIEYLGRDVADLDTVKMVCTDSGIKSFNEALLGLDKKQSLIYTKERGPSNLEIDELTRDVFNLSILQSAMGEHSLQVRPLSDETGLSPQQVKTYLPVASSYDTGKARRSFHLLTVLDKNLRQGDRAAVLSLITGW